MNSLVHSLFSEYYIPHDGFQHNFATLMFSQNNIT